MLDLSRILAGPTATQLLGDLGADIIKVERPGTGDDTRTWGPPFVTEADGAAGDRSAYFVCANRNKRSIAIDIATDAGAALVRRLAATADVVVENYKPGDLARRRLSWDDLRSEHPRLVWCSITAFGQTGPYRDRIGYDIMAQAMGGIMSITGAPDGGPQKVGVGIADVVCGLYATVGILAALAHRERTGAGQFIDLALYDAQLAWLINAATNHLVSGAAPRRHGNRHPNIAPYQTYRAADGHLVVAVGNDEQFRRFCNVIGRPELGSDRRFATNPARVAAVDALEAELAPALLARPVAAWMELLTAASVPASPVATIPDALADPHTTARAMVVEMNGDGVPIRVLGNPLKLSATPVRYDRAPPALGADTMSVLAELGLDDAAIEAMATAGAFGAVRMERA